MTAGLTLVSALRLGLAADRLAVRHAGRSHIDLDAELVLQVVDRHLDRRLADGGENRLVRRVFATNMQGRVLVGELVQRGRELVEVGFARWLDRYGERRRREVDGVVLDHGVLVAQGRVRRRRRKLLDRADVARADRVRRLLLLSAEEKDLTHALGLLLRRVEDLG